MWLNSASIDSLGHSWLLLVFWNISYRVIQYFYDCTLRQHIKIVNSDTNIVTIIIMTIIRLCHSFSSKKFAKFSRKSFCRTSLVTAS